MVCLWVQSSSVQIQKSQSRCSFNTKFIAGWVACFGVSLVNVSIFLIILPFSLWYLQNNSMKSGQKSSPIGMMASSHAMEKRMKKVQISRRKPTSVYIAKCDFATSNVNLTHQRTDELGFFLRTTSSELNQFTRIKHAQFPKISNEAKKTHIFHSCDSGKKVNDSRQSHDGNNSSQFY